MKIFLLIIAFLMPHAGVFADGEQASLAEAVAAKVPGLSGYLHAQTTPQNEAYTTLFLLADGASAVTSSDARGDILSFEYHSREQRGKKRLPSVGKEQAAESVLTFLQSAAGELLPQLNTTGLSITYSANTTPQGYSARLVRMVNGVSFPANSVSLWVDPFTGMVTRYARTWDSAVAFSRADQILSKAEAEEKFLENIGLELRYNRRVESDRITPYLVYVPSSTASLDAATGAAIPVRQAQSGNILHEISSIHEGRISSAYPVESAIALSEQLKSGEEALDFARSMPELGIDSGYVPQQAKYFKDTNGEYLMTVQFRKQGFISNVTLNAVTLEITAFSSTEAASLPPLPGNIAGPTAVAGSVTANYLSAHLPELSPPSVRIVTDDKGAASYYVTYERMVNGIPYKANGAHFLVGANGRLLAMSFHKDNAVFASAEDVISPGAAARRFLSGVGLSLIYAKTGESAASLSYVVNPQIPGVIDAKSGEVLAYDGRVYLPARMLSYLDLKGHFAEQSALALAQVDIFVSQGAVRLDDFIRQKDYITLLLSVSEINPPIHSIDNLTAEDYEILYTAFVTAGILDKAEITPHSGVNREQAVRWLMRATGYRDIAELPGIYRMPFLDANQITDGNYGYIGLAKGLGIIQGSYGYFYPRQHLTNAEALIMIYNYLNRS